MKIRTRLATIVAVLAVPIGTFAAGALLAPDEPQITTTNKVVRLTAPESVADRDIAASTQAIDLRAGLSG